MSITSDHIEGVIMTVLDVEDTNEIEGSNFAKSKLVHLDSSGRTTDIITDIQGELGCLTGKSFGEILIW